MNEIDEVRKIKVQYPRYWINILIIEHECSNV